MSEQDLDEGNITTNAETDETTVEESQANLEADVPTYETEEDDGLTDAQRRFKEQRREENRKAREALKKVPQLEAELEFNRFLRKNPDAENYEKEINDFRAKNPTIGLDKAYRYILADLNPAKLAELSDSGQFAQQTQERTAPLGGEKSFSEQIGNTPNTVQAGLQQAEKIFKELGYGR